VDDPLLVRRVEAVGDLPRDLERLVDRDGPAATRSASVVPSTSSMTIAGRAVRIVDKTEDGGDVRMMQRLRFAFEPRQPIAIECERVGKNLDRDVALQLRIAGAVDLAHSAGPQRTDDLIWADSDTGGETHGASWRATVDMRHALSATPADFNRDGSDADAGRESRPKGEANGRRLSA